ncbi:hypothetical protein Vadar_012791 [Vaccinium darrowii]|uniref:Uncharacterized protein n=1 Tax=Vaccinium darrowii TaxID=229202 RepID=A0ACB7XQ85_9ERIC|nr:hypothetical protein Vadar_012791 [Vaccinium darrowii]
MHSSYNSTQSMPKDDDLLCIICGTQKLIQTSWTDRNLGRRFISCPKNGCDEFAWLDPPMCRRSVRIIPGLLKKVNRLEMEAARAKAGEKKMKMYLVASWVVLAAVVFENKLLNV